MEVGLTRLDGKGRIVIPKRVRDAAGLYGGCAILIYGFGRCVLLNKARLEPSDEPAQTLLPRLGKGAIGKLGGEGRRESAPHERGEVVA